MSPFLALHKARMPLSRFSRNSSLLYDTCVEIPVPNFMTIRQIVQSIILGDGRTDRRAWSPHKGSFSIRKECLTKNGHPLSQCFVTESTSALRGKLCEEFKLSLQSSKFNNC